MSDTTSDPLPDHEDPRRRRLAEICCALPEVTSSGDRHVGFAVRGRTFAWFLDDHHGDGRLVAPKRLAREIASAGR